MEQHRPELPEPRRPISSARHGAPPPPARHPDPATATFPAGSYPFASGPSRRAGARSRQRRRRIRWALAALTASVAIAAGGIWAQGATRTTQATGRTAAATPVRNKNLSAAAVADQNDAAIVDVITTLGYQNGQAAGTGIVLTSSGEILTNHHVIQGSTSITVKVSNSSQTYKATVVGFDATDDIAILQAAGASGLATAPLGNSSAVAVNQSVVAIGNALNKPGLPTVTEGTVTQLGRAISVSGDNGTTEQLKNLLETSAPLQPGNSGGPLFDTAGEVIGINTAASAGNIPTQGTNDGFAIPINDAVTIAHQIESGHSTDTVHIGASPFLGIQIQRGGQDLGGGVAPGSSSGSGVTVGGVEPGTPAEAAGITAGDQIIAVGGTTVSSQSDVTAALSAKHPGDTITVTWVDQSNAQHQATIRLAVGPIA
jgi:S1-C subfamily serine protease